MLHFVSNLVPRQMPSDSHYEGCYPDQPGYTVYDQSQSVTADICIQSCWLLNFTYAAISVSSTTLMSWLLQFDIWLN